MRKVLILVLAFVACSGSSFGGVISALRLLKHATGVASSFLIGYRASAVPVVVLENVRGAPAPKPLEEQKKKILLEIDAAGKVSAVDGAVLATDEKITAFLKAKKVDCERAGLLPTVFLRASDKASFESVRRVIRLASELKLNEISFAAFHAGDADPDLREEPALALPEQLPRENDPIIAPLFIALDAEGAVSLNSGPAREELDQALADRKLPLLTQRVEMYAAAARAAGADPRVELHVNAAVHQRRVVDVLHVLQRFEIDKVTFMDLADDD